MRRVASRDWYSRAIVPRTTMSASGPGNVTLALPARNTSTSPRRSPARHGTGSCAHLGLGNHEGRGTAAAQAGRLGLGLAGAGRPHQVEPAAPRVERGLVAGQRERFGEHVERRRGEVEQQQQPRRLVGRAGRSQRLARRARVWRERRPAVEAGGARHGDATAAGGAARHLRALQTLNLNSITSPSWTV